uniref:Uncharacterized protein n=1 Tax=Rhizophora mucronata TaxID=61149 RepID=A0A2P2II92_RHIMU
MSFFCSTMFYCYVSSIANLPTKMVYNGEKCSILEILHLGIYLIQFEYNMLICAVRACRFH